ncbi:Thiol-disulfide oxidoreductase ResA [Aquisphaera giovannonii]|uniref:Thiol-disulfide oxidoreductase ResA n=1 Tax=Aquisphaera giovannonii TaxID=406548 RepID=A0A5B9W706_9BACT|nr:redoxin domain-containing protein [Aquisphaera giovannonii]QEH35875.1 Thiol-disulfide oxidoreductase ResA [Aquisphaera giovannonii]
MHANRFPRSARIGARSAILLAHGAFWFLLAAAVQSAGVGAAPFPDEPAAHAAYDRMNDAMRRARSLSYTSRYGRESGGVVRNSCSYRIWLKKPNYFRMETRSDEGEPGGNLVGDGANLWIYWPRGRPKWQLVAESDADSKTRFTSYMTRPAPEGGHSILHEAPLLGGGMGFPILDASAFHGHVDSIRRYLDAVRGVGSETIRGEDCDGIELSFMDGQRTWRLWLSRRDHLPRRMEEVVRVKSEIITREEWSSVEIDREIPDATFAWTPPAGWTEWRLPDDEGALLKPGSKAPDFDLASVDGGRIRLSDFRGKAVWICFWRLGCPPCREELPHLQSVYSGHKDRGLVVLGVNVSDDREIVRDFLRERGVTFPNVLDTSPTAEQTWSRAYGVGAIPVNYLIDRDGVVVDAWIGYVKDAARADSALKSLGVGVAGGGR